MDSRLTTILDSAKRIKAIADIGLLYAKDPYDRERYHELQAIALNLLAGITDQPLTSIKDLFLPIKDYPTAKVDIRGIALSKEGKILLVQESLDQAWSLPGGWADIGFTPRETVVTEFREETGLEVVPLRVLAIFDKKMHPHPSQPHYVYKIVFLCEIVSGTIQKGFDVLDVQYFAPDALPKLSEDRILKSQIEILLNKIQTNDLLPYVD
jgi:ADP-ribose pyrophosphatase YjhB (NUDIX family)